MSPSTHALRVLWLLCLTACTATISPSRPGERDAGPSGDPTVDAGIDSGIDGGDAAEEGLPLPTPEPRLHLREGPGLGNLRYDEPELFQAIGRIDAQNGVPDDSPGEPYGLNAAVMHDGYLMTLFAPGGGAGPGGLLFYDLEDPRHVRLVHRVYEPTGRTSELRTAQSIALSYVDGQEYAALQSGRGIEVWEISDVRAPQQVAKLALEGVNFGDFDAVAWQLFWQGRMLYVAAANQGIFLVDMTDARAPQLVDRGPGRANPVPIGELGGFRVGPLYAVGNLLIVTGMSAEYGYSTLDIGDPRQPSLISTLRRGLSEFHATTFNGNRLIASVRGADAHMTVHDTKDPRELSLLEATIVLDEQRYAATQDHYVFQGCQREVAKIDAATPGAYRVVGRGVLGAGMADHGRVTPMANLLFVGSDHGSGGGLVVHDREPDTAAPVVNMVHPADGAVLQPTTTRIGLTFTDSVEPYSVNETTFVVRPVGEARGIAGRYAVQLGIANFWPDEPLAPNTTYEVIVQAGGVADWAGNLTAEQFRSTFTTAPEFDELPVHPGLVGWWRLDRAQADSAEDSSPSGAHGILLGDADVTSDGLVLDGDGDAVQVSHPAMDFDGDLSIALWVRTDSTSNEGQDRPGAFWRGEWLVDKDLPGPGGWALTNHYGKAKFAVDVDAETLVSRSRIDDDQWHHIAATRSRDGQRALYIDGTLEAVSESGSTASIYEVGDLFLGSESGARHFARASLRDVKILNAFLDETEVREQMQGVSRLSVSLSRLPAVVAGSSVTLNAQASGAGTLYYSFDFGDGSVPSALSSASSAVRKFSKPGHYPIRVSVTNGVELASASAMLTVHRPVGTTRGARSRNIVYDELRGLACAVNPDHDTASCIDAHALRLVFEQTVGKHPTSLALGPDRTLWVVNEGSDSLTVIGLDDGKVLRTVPVERGSHPYGIAFTPELSRAYVTLEARGEVVEVQRDGSLGARRAVGVGARGIAITLEGDRLFVSRFLSPDAGGELRVLDVNEFDGSRVVDLPPDRATQDGEGRARGLPNYVGSLSMSPDGTMGLVPAKKDNVYRGLKRDGKPLTFESTLRALAMQISLASEQENVGARIDFDDREGARDIEFSPLGDYAYVALAGSNMVEVRDAYSGALVTDLRRGGIAPFGLASSADGARLFVHNFLSRSIDVYDTRTLSASEGFTPTRVGTVNTTTREVLSPEVLRGKILFHAASDTRLGRDGYLACASCHLDGGHDGRTWDFSDRGEGLRNTIALVGRAGTAHGPLHWTASFDEVQDIEQDLRGPFAGSGLMADADWQRGSHALSLGDRKAGVSADLDALAAYVGSLDAFPKSPHRASGGIHTDAARAGEALFRALGCDNCHGGSEYTNSAAGQRFDVGTVRETSGSRMGGPLDGLDTPTLRGVWQTAPYLHDGSAKTLADVLVTRNLMGQHGDVNRLTSNERDQLVRFLLELE